MQFKKVNTTYYEDGLPLKGAKIDTVLIPDFILDDTDELIIKLCLETYEAYVDGKAKKYVVIDSLFFMNDELLPISEAFYTKQEMGFLCTADEQVNGFVFDFTKKFPGFKYADFNDLRRYFVSLRPEEVLPAISEIKGLLKDLISTVAVIQVEEPEIEAEVVIEPQILLPDLDNLPLGDDQSDIDISNMPFRQMGDFTEYNWKKGAGDFLNSTPAYGMLDYVSSIKKKMKPREWVQLAEFLQLNEKLCAMMYRWQQSAKLLEVVAGDYQSFKDAYATITADPSAARKNAKSIKKSNAMDHIASRLPQAAEAHETMISLNENPRKGEMAVYVNLFSDCDNFYMVADSSNLVQYPTSLEDGMVKFTNYLANSVHSAKKDLFPHTPHSMQVFEDDQFDILADVRISSKKDNPSLLGLMFSTQGGQLSEEDSQVTYAHVGALATALGTGVPDVFKLRGAYQHDEDFRHQFDEFAEQKVKVRQASRAIGVMEDFVDTSLKYMKIWSVKEKTSDLIHRTTAPRMSEVVPRINSLVEDLHHLNRQVALATSSDRSVFTTFGIRANLTPTEGTTIKMVNDLICAGNRVTIKSALDYVGTGYVMSHDGLYRPQCYQNDKVAIGINTMQKFDQVLGTGGLRVLVDFTLKSQKIYMGGKEWEDKIKPRGFNERRSYVFADFEPEMSKNLGEDRFVHPKPPEVNEQWEYFRQLVKDDRYDYISTIVPIRYLLEASKQVRIIMALPAPHPATMCAWVLVANSNKVVGESMSPVHIYMLLSIYARKMGLIIETYANGSAGYRKLLKMQMSFQTVICPDFVKKWVQLMKDRHVGNSNVTILKVVDRVDYLLRAGKKENKKLNVNMATKQSRMINREMQRF